MFGSEFSYTENATPWLTHVTNDPDEFGRILDCAEATDIKTWALPEAYLLEFLIRRMGDIDAVLVGYTALDPQSLGRSAEYSGALDLFSRIIGKQEGLLKVLASLQATALRQVRV